MWCWVDICGSIYVWVHPEFCKGKWDGDWGEKWWDCSCYLRIPACIEL